MNDALCIQCHKDIIYIEHSKKYCKRCFDARRRANKKYNKLHLKENYERTRRWIRCNPQKSKEYQKIYREKHQKEIKEYRKKYKRSNVGKMASKRYYEKHKLRILEKT